MTKEEIIQGINKGKAFFYDNREYVDGEAWYDKNHLVFRATYVSHRGTCRVVTKSVADLSGFIFSEDL